MKNSRVCSDWHERYLRGDSEEKKKKIRRIRFSAKDKNERISSRVQNLMHILVILFTTSLAQTDRKLCSCSPSAFTFKLDFSLTCSPVNINVNPTAGVDEVFCEISHDPSLMLVDEKPVAINQVTIFELNLGLSVLRQTVFTGLNLSDGDTYSFKSIVSEATDKSSLDELEIPGGLQIELRGVNAADEIIANTFILTYSNRCDIEPFFVDESIGWSVFAGLESPPGGLCPLYFINSAFPSTAPSLSPIQRPTPIPSFHPSNTFTQRPTEMRTNAPTRTFLALPTQEPTEQTGNELCSCSPSSFTFRLDFSLKCLPVNANPTSGVNNVWCEISPGDEKPVEINRITIFELKKDLTVLRKTHLPRLNLSDGDTYSFKSIVSEATGMSSLDELDIPWGLQVELKGVNAADDKIMSSFIVEYSNRCDVEPFSVKESFGWSVIAGLESPPGGLCPLYSLLPTQRPTDTWNSGDVLLSYDYDFGTDDLRKGSNTSSNISRGKREKRKSKSKKRKKRRKRKKSKSSKNSKKRKSRRRYNERVDSFPPRQQWTNSAWTKSGDSFLDSLP